MVVNLSALDRRSLLGRAMRWPLRLIPANARLPILQGRLRGLRWIVGSSNHGCWLGSYERAQQLLFDRWVKQGDTVYDLGAHVGFYSLLASVLVGSTGRVVAFEPVGENLAHLETHLRINSISNVTVIRAAVSDRGGRARLASGPSSSMWLLDEGGELEVEAECLDDLVRSRRLPPPDVIKMDIEGAELRALRGGADVIERHHPVIFLSTHGPEVDKQCRAFLVSTGYRLTVVDQPSLGGFGTLLAVHHSRA